MLQEWPVGNKVPQENLQLSQETMTIQCGAIILCGMSWCKACCWTIPIALCNMDKLSSCTFAWGGLLWWGSLGDQMHLLYSCHWFVYSRWLNNNKILSALVVSSGHPLIRGALVRLGMGSSQGIMWGHGVGIGISWLCVPRKNSSWGVLQATKC